MNVIKTVILVSILAISSGANSAIVDTSAAVITPDAITNIFVDGVEYRIDIGDGLVSEVYNGLVLPEVPSANDIPVAVNLALTDLFNERGIGPGFLSGCEPTLCVLFIPEAYNLEREYYSFNNTLWLVETWINDEGDLRSDYDSGPTAATLGKLSQVPLPAAAWLFGSALLGLGLIKRKKA